MSILPNEIVLRPRFQLQLNQPKDLVLKSFEIKNTPPFIVKRMDDHVFIKFNRENVHFWSPQLHLEINDAEEGGCKVFGLFGPNPTLWTFFMFLHFGVATVFIGLGIWAYSSASLGRPIGLHIGLMAVMVILWFVLYAFGRAGRSKGKPQMHELHRFMNQRLGQ
ncbi:GTP-binding protein [Maribacter polysaccharolyticus]|uniref:GTP-binding protein n=1 Tax=Maribacter polysaccharolyticus TaxID=3020831 RepID=UPI00237F4EB1|nr:GTP-binding protein [Maribacter polysaccharolyticus]MDE3742761.1 GTP-binding protein [Maribacter polysaccharolyticus]